MRIFDNGVYRDMTPEEEREFLEQEQITAALRQGDTSPEAPAELA